MFTCHNLKKNLVQWGHTAWIIVLVLAGIAFVVTAIGWYTCAYTHYCPDPKYPYVYKTQNNPEVYVCAQSNDCFPGPSNPSIGSPTHHCSNYDGWMWSFIVSLVILIVLGLSCCQCQCDCQKRQVSETSIEIPTKVSAETSVEMSTESRVEIPVETPIETPETPIEVFIETPFETLLENPRATSTSHLRIEIPP